MKSWTWQKVIGKFLLLAVAVAGAVVDLFGMVIDPGGAVLGPLWAILMPGVTWVAQFVIGLLPGEAWQGIVGKGLLLVVSLVQLVVDQFSPGNQFWVVIAPLVTAIAQYFLSLIPPQPATS